MLLTAPAPGMPVGLAAVAVQDILFYLLFPVGAVILGAIIATVRVPSSGVQSMIQHFAAGVVFAAVSTELLPDVLDRRLPLEVVLGFALGIAVMLGVRALARRLEPPEAEAPRAPQLIAREAITSFPVGLLVIVAIDITVDGLLVGLAFAAGAKAGLLLTLALTLEVLFLGLATTVALQKARAPRGRVIGIVTGLALLLGGGAIVGAVILGGLSGELLEVVLAFGLAALLFLVTEELLVEAHEVPETTLATSTFFVGFLMLMLITMAVEG